MWGGVERGSCCRSTSTKNESGRSTEGMIGNSSLLAAVLTVVSVVSLSLLSFLCLRCKRKSMIIYEEHQIYSPETFQREGSMFAVTRSKTVTKTNQRTLTTNETQEELSPDATEQSDYENVVNTHIRTTMEHTYVTPMPHLLYENEDNMVADAGQTPEDYVNILPVKDDVDDYENSQFFDQAEQEQDDEPDYVNENGDCT